MKNLWSQYIRWSNTWSRSQFGFLVVVVTILLVALILTCYRYETANESANYWRSQSAQDELQMTKFRLEIRNLQSTNRINKLP